MSQGQTLAPLALVVAVSANGFIGRDGGLPWHLPEDLKHFRRMTIGHAVIMGRKTWESIGRPLPGRRNIVVTRQRDYEAPGCDVVHDLQSAIELAREGGEGEPRIVGGSGIYAEAMPLVTRMFLTEVHQEVDGDTRFPDYDRTRWREDAREEGEGCSFVTLSRATSDAP